MRTIYVHVGNDHAIEGYRDPKSDDPDLVRYRPLKGQRVTEVVFPEGTTINDAFTTTVAALSAHMEEDAVPAWVVSDSKGLQALLAENWGDIPTTKPAKWGTDTGAPEFLKSRDN